MMKHTLEFKTEGGFWEISQCMCHQIIEYGFGMFCFFNNVIIIIINTYFLIPIFCICYLVQC
jgi:hypothetical protein